MIYYLYRREWLKDSLLLEKTTYLTKRMKNVKYRCIWSHNDLSKNETYFYTKHFLLVVKL